MPITYATSRRHIAATWDRFHVALPFGRGVFLWGEPIEIAADLDECRARTRPPRDRRAHGRHGGRGRPARRPSWAAAVGGSPDAISRPGERSRRFGPIILGNVVPTGTRSVMLPLVYRALTWPLPPLVLLYLRHRRRRGKEDARAPARASRFDPDCAAAGPVDLDTRRQRRRGDGDATADRAAGWRGGPSSRSW